MIPTDRINMFNYIKFLLIVVIALILGCSQSVKKEPSYGSFSHINQPQDLYIEKEVKSSVDSLYLFYKHALNALKFGDSLGARIYYEKIFFSCDKLQECVYRKR